MDIFWDLMLKFSRKALKITFYKNNFIIIQLLKTYLIIALKS